MKRELVVLLVFAVVGFVVMGLVGALPKGVIPEDSGSPFYVNSSVLGNPYSGACSDLLAGESCVLTWSVYPNGTVGLSYEFFAFGNSSFSYNISGVVNVTIVNSLPSVTLDIPDDWNSTANRTPEFTWTGYDADDDSLTFEINISEHLFAGAKFCDDDRSDNSLGSESYIPSSDLLCLHDNGYYYNWSVRAHDGTGWGEWSSVWHLNVTAEIDVNLSVNEINFGSLDLGEIENTSDDNPGPFVLDNDGNVVTNISLNSSAIWNTESSDSSYYQFKVDNVTGEEGAFDWLLSIVSWFNMPITGEVVAVGELNYSDGKDSVETDIRLEVPPAEAPGVKNATIIFKGELAE